MMTRFPRRVRFVPVLAAIAALGAIASAPALASSHREAPDIARNPSVDATDFYMFRSYEGVAADGSGGRSGFVTILANYQPLQNPQDGPNYYQFNPNALYEIHIDNTGSGSEALTFQFRFTNTSKAAALTIGTKAVKVPLIATAPGNGTATGPTLNVNETYTLNLVRGDRRTGAVSAITNASGGSATFTKPVDNIGDKAFGSTTAYAAYANQYIYNITIPGCATAGKVFVGQRKESFYIALGKVFDFFNINPLGPEVGGNQNDLEAKNISTLALELPISCLTAGADPVIGAWTTASQRQGRLLKSPVGTGLNQVAVNGGAWTQVSRLGMPLVNEAVIGLDDKDKFNSSKPKNDGIATSTFPDYVTNPTLPAILASLFGVTAPTNLPRTDLVTAFLKGIKGVNQPATSTVLAEMLRLNTSIAPKPVAAQNSMGVLAGDNAGFPNGRRPADDVVDATVRVAMGALCVATGTADALQVGCKPSDAPQGGLLYTDGVRKTAANFGATFPYLTTPLPGNFNPTPPAGSTFP